jgi:uncharacterized protein (UPF0297 family)
MSDQKLFIKLANPCVKGISRIVFTEEFIDIYSKLATTNGGGWSRMDAKNILTKTYNFVSINKKDIRFTGDTEETEKKIIMMEINDRIKVIKEREKTKTNKIIAYKLIGLRHTVPISRQIRTDIRDYFKDKRCVISFIFDIEIDHKNGRYNNPRVNNIKTQTIEDFQPLSKGINDAKRQHCKNCKKTGIRFDAKVLGHKVSFTSGTSKYIESPDGCVGCYWYDIYAFNSHDDIEDLCKKITKL